ncbi:hypothetical protein CO179_05790 [candidate division WWE3 bacterium CG_4_9_14_3_um_filter_39_7]|uniref:Uncharacterized protein n=1 Tax=candidate division WWE3 bacterium CG_4_9_14_3_um_filter_39_7 TaxID=1975080 RepID=A0A2M7X016_UNCKA|nr:MAG: hypothetical protein CO179_05790 [candidate division WWE3 bacterium CG_4_9_14_3_um_filter_39_7]
MTIMDLKKSVQIIGALDFIKNLKQRKSIPKSVVVVIAILIFHGALTFFSGIHDSPTIDEGLA